MVNLGHEVRCYEARLSGVAGSVRRWPKPKVYFEEWDDPLISGIGWVSELIEIAGGKGVPELGESTDCVRGETELGVIWQRVGRFDR